MTNSSNITVFIPVTTQDQIEELWFQLQNWSFICLSDLKDIVSITETNTFYTFVKAIQADMEKQSGRSFETVNYFWEANATLVMFLLAEAGEL